MFCVLIKGSEDRYINVYFSYVQMTIAENVEKISDLESRYEDVTVANELHNQKITEVETKQAVIDTKVKEIGETTNSDKDEHL